MLDLQGAERRLLLSVQHCALRELLWNRFLFSMTINGFCRKILTLPQVTSLSEQKCLCLLLLEFLNWLKAWSTYAWSTFACRVQYSNHWSQASRSNHCSFVCPCMGIFGQKLALRRSFSMYQQERDLVQGSFEGGSSRLCFTRSIRSFSHKPTQETSRWLANKYSNQAIRSTWRCQLALRLSYSSF